MAASSKSTQGIASFGKRAIYQIWPATSASRLPSSPNSPAASAPTSLFGRTILSSAYEKNLDEHVRPHVVPEDVIKPGSDKYWAPHPQTGVFGPITQQQSNAGLNSAPANSDQGTILEEKAWFRPTSLEDLEKPLHH